MGAGLTAGPATRVRGQAQGGIPWLRCCPPPYRARPCSSSWAH